MATLRAADLHPEKTPSRLLRSLLTVPILTLFVATGVASAETVIDGDIEIEVQVDYVTTMAESSSNAETDIGSILDDTYINGRTRLSVKTNEVQTRAASMSTACTSIGSIGGCKEHGGDL